TLVARLDSLSNPDALAKAGLMFRAGSPIGSINFALFDTVASGLMLSWRSVTDGTTSIVTVAGVGAPSTANPVWLKVANIGNVFSAYYATGATPPSSWTQV